MWKSVGGHRNMGSRVDNWEAILSRELEKKRTFVRGKSDCVYFALSVVKNITNIDLTKDGKKEYGEYKSKYGYKKLLMDHWLKYGESRMCEPSVYGAINYLCKKNGFLEIPKSLAQRGDLVMTVNHTNEEALGIKTNQGSCYLAFDGTYVNVPIEQLNHAWAIR
jgi:hypothetical protein